MHSAKPHPDPISPGGDPERNIQLMGLAALGGYFYNLAKAEINEKAVLEELVTNLTTLTDSNT